MMELPHSSKFVAENISSTERSSVNTSIITVRATDHLKEREIERAVERREQQKAVKRGEGADAVGDVKHHHDGVKMVTTPDFKGGVTVMRSGRYRTELCKWWERGNCKNGDRCTYAHGVHELRAPMAYSCTHRRPAPSPRRRPRRRPPRRPIVWQRQSAAAAPACRGLAAAGAAAAPAYRNLAAAEAPPAAPSAPTTLPPVPAAEEAWREAPKPDEEAAAAAAVVAVVVAAAPFTEPVSHLAPVSAAGVRSWRRHSWRRHWRPLQRRRRRSE